jgi:hypothetical protein
MKKKICKIPSYRMMTQRPPIMQGPPQNAPVPRVVLINPNFKGGVEAAKSKFLTKF